MFSWVCNFFKSNTISHEDDLTDIELEEMIDRMEKAEQAINERRHMQFVCMVSNELFPGDNTAMTRVETAINNAVVYLSKIDD